MLILRMRRVIPLICPHRNRKTLGRRVYGAFFCPPFYERGVIMIFPNLVTDFSRMGYVRTDDDENIELTADSNEFDDEEAIVRKIEDICDRYSLNCVIDKNGVSDEGITFIVTGGTFEIFLYLVIA